MELRFTAKFKRGYERAKKRGKDISKLELTLEALVRGEALPEAMRDRSLGGTYRGHRECHIEPTGCSSTASTRTGSSSSLHVRGTKRATRAVRHSNLHSEEEGHNVSINSS